MHCQTHVLPLPNMSDIDLPHENVETENKIELKRTCSPQWEPDKRPTGSEESSAAGDTGAGVGDFFPTGDAGPGVGDLPFPFPFGDCASGVGD